MANPSDILTQLSNALTARTTAARDAIAAIQLAGARH